MMSFFSKVLNRAAKMSVANRMIRQYALRKRAGWKPLPDAYERNARDVISALHPKPEGHAYWNTPYKKTYAYDLSVIVPFYNTEQYAVKCIESILNQKTSFSVEVILVDDGSPDHVGEILDRYAAADNVKVIRKENGGVAEARNTGILCASGKYIMFVDSDAFLANGAIEALLQEAMASAADIVEGAYTVFHERRHYKQSLIQNHSYSVLSNGKTMYGYPWGKVYKARLFETVCFPAGYWFEDTIIAGLVFSLAGVTVTVPQTVYWYYINQSGLTYQVSNSPRSIDTYYIFEELFEAKRKLNIPITGSTKSAVIWQLSQYVYGRCKAIGDENLKHLFVLCARLAEAYGVLEEEYVSEQSFWAGEVCEAFSNLQYERWKLAAKMI